MFGAQLSKLAEEPSETESTEQIGGTAQKSKVQYSAVQCTPLKKFLLLTSFPFHRVIMKEHGISQYHPTSPHTTRHHTLTHTDLLEHDADAAALCFVNEWLGSIADSGN